MGGAVDVDPFRGGAFVGGSAFANFVVEDDGGAGDGVEACIVQAGDGVAEGEIFGSGQRYDLRGGEAVELDARESAA